MYLNTINKVTQFYLIEHAEIVGLGIPLTMERQDMCLIYWLLGTYLCLWP